MHAAGGQMVRGGAIRDMTELREHRCVIAALDRTVHHGPRTGIVTLTDQIGGQFDQRHGLIGFLGKTQMANIVYFDLETQKVASEVGGWAHIDKMGLAVAVLYHTDREEYGVYLEKDAEKLIQDLRRADLVVGFDLDVDRIKRLADGDSYIEDITDERLRAALDAA